MLLLPIRLLDKHNTDVDMAEPDQDVVGHTALVHYPSPPNPYRYSRDSS